MKKHKNLNLGRYAWAMMFACALCFSACSEEDTPLDENRMEMSGGDIRFGLSLVDNAWEPDTRSAKSDNRFVLRSEKSSDTLCVSTSVQQGILSSGQVHSRGTTVNSLANGQFKVTAYYYPAAGETVPGNTLFSDEVVSVGDNGTATNMATTYYWPQEGDFTFLATANGDGLTITDKDAGGNYLSSPSLSYTIPDEVDNQKDVMVAFTGPDRINNGTTGAAVPLTFNHLCAAVQFQLTSEVDNTISGISISGVKGGEVEYTFNNGAWTSSAPTTDKTYSITLNPAISGNTVITSDANNTTLLLAPQTLTEDAKITITFSDGRTSVSTEDGVLKDKVWKMGQTFIFKLSITPEYTLKFVDEQGGHPKQDAHYVIDQVKINVDPQLTGGWTVTSSDEDVTLNTQLTELQSKGYWTDYMYTNDDQAVRTNTIEGTATGEVTVYVFWPENVTKENRKVTLTLTSKDHADCTDTYEMEQLCPSWYTDTHGCERIEGGPNIWGFSWSEDLVVTYDLTECSDEDRTDISRQIRWIQALGSIFPNWFEEDYSYIKHEHDGGFLGTGLLSKTNSITINFGELMKEDAIRDIAINTSEGDKNTEELFEFRGLTEIADIMAQLQDMPGIKTEGGDGLQVVDYAAKDCAMLNKFGKEVQEQNGEKTDIAVYSSYAWYLPAKDEVAGIKDDDYPLNGDYWTSTAVASTEGITDYSELAWKYNAGSPNNPATDKRTVQHNVRCVRKLASN